MTAVAPLLYENESFWGAAEVRTKGGTCARADVLMRRAGRIAVLVAALAGCLPLSPAAALELVTSIDLDYTYEQRNIAGAVNAATRYQQIYQLKYATSLSSALDFLGTVRLEIDDRWSTREANTSRVSPTLELEVKGDQLAAKLSYQGAIGSSDQFRELAAAEKVSNSVDLDVELTPTYWPELKLKMQSKRDYQQQMEDATTRFVELELREEIYDLRLEYQMRLSEDIDVLPVRGNTDTTDWSMKTTYKRELYYGTDFEVSHEIKESYSETSTRDVFASSEQSYDQVLRARVRSSLDLTSRLGVVLSWEYTFDQDLLALDYDYKVDNKYAIEGRYDMLPSLKFLVGAKRDTTATEPATGRERKAEVTDSVRGSFDFTPIDWLRFNGKAELKTKQTIAEDTGGSVDRTDEENYELAMKNNFGDFWELTVNGSYMRSYADGYIDNEESKLKAALKLVFEDLTIGPEYEGTRENEWDGPGRPDQQRSVGDFKITFDYKYQLLELLTLTFYHEYATKLTRELDAALVMEEERQLNETTRLNLTLVDWIDGLRIEGEVERKGSDTEDDPDPQLVEVTYALKFDWQIRDLTLGANFKYNDKGDAFDDMNLTTKITWKSVNFGVSGEYQLGKVYADETDEGRKLNLKLYYKF